MSPITGQQNLSPAVLSIRSFRRHFVNIRDGEDPSFKSGSISGSLIILFLEKGWPSKSSCKYKPEYLIRGIPIPLWHYDDTR